MVISRPVRLVA